METIQKINTIIQNDINSYAIINSCFRSTRELFKNLKETYYKYFENLIKEAENKNLLQINPEKSFLNIINQNLLKIFSMEEYLDQKLLKDSQEFEEIYKKNCQNYQMKADKIQKQASELQSNFRKMKNNYLESNYRMNFRKSLLNQEININNINKGSKNEVDVQSKYFYAEKDRAAKSELEFAKIQRGFNNFLNKNIPKYDYINENYANFNKDKQSNLVKTFEAFKMFTLEISQIFSNMSNDIQNLIRFTEAQNISKLDNPLKGFNSLFEDNIQLLLLESTQNYKTIDAIQDKLKYDKIELKKNESVDNELTQKNLMELKSKNNINLDNNKLIDSLSEILKGRYYKKYNIKNFLHQNNQFYNLNLYLRNIESLIGIRAYDSFIVLELLFNDYLNYLNKHGSSASELVVVLLSSKNICFINNKNRKTYLISRLVNHSIWRELETWRKIINERISFCYSSQNLPLIYSEEITSKENGLMQKCITGIKKVSSMIKQLSNNPYSNLITNKKVKNSMVFILQSFCFILAIFKIPKEFVRNLLKEKINEHELNPSSFQEFLIEFYSCFPIDPQYFNNKKLREKNSNNQSFKNPLQNNLIILKKVIPFIFDLFQLRKFLILSKEFMKEISNKVMEQILIKIHTQIPIDSKIKLWKFILYLNSSQLELSQTFNPSNGETINENPIFDMIKNDVSRSYAHIKEINPHILTNVLKKYALFDPKIGYCQGMNYIAGFLCLIFKEEDEVYKSFLILMEHYDLKQIYDPSMSFLKFCFFMLDKLIAYYFPDFHLELKLENINSSQFSSSWFLTLFCTILQNSKDSNISKFLETIWDIFLIKKWKGIFKIVLFLISIINDGTISKNTNLLSNLCEIVKSEEFDHLKNSENLKIKFSQWKVTNTIIKQTLSEYNELNNQVGPSLIPAGISSNDEEDKSEEKKLT